MFILGAERHLEGSVVAERLSGGSPVRAGIVIWFEFCPREVLGFISIPFMAGAGFMLITVLLAFYVRASNHE